MNTVHGRPGCGRDLDDPSASADHRRTVLRVRLGPQPRLLASLALLVTSRRHRIESLDFVADREGADLVLTISGPARLHETVVHRVRGLVGVIRVDTVRQDVGH